MIVVDSPDLLSAAIPMTEFGDIRIVSSPRLSKTWPVCPVRILSPGLIITPSARTSHCPAVVTEASPDDLLTRQTASSTIAPDPRQNVTKVRSNSSAKKDRIVSNMGAPYLPSLYVHSGIHLHCSDQAQCRWQFFLIPLFHTSHLT